MSDIDFLRGVAVKVLMRQCFDSLLRILKKALIFLNTSMQYQ